MIVVDCMPPSVARLCDTVAHWGFGRRRRVGPDSKTVVRSTCDEIDQRQGRAARG